MRYFLLIIAALALVGCGGYREAMDKKIAKAKAEAEAAKAVAEAKAHADAEANATVTPKPEPPKATLKKLITNPIVEKAIRSALLKPKGKLTKADLEVMQQVLLDFTKITDAGLKDVAKLQNLQQPLQVTLPHSSP